MPRFFISLIAILLAAMPCSPQGRAPKREFRGAWISTVYQEQYRTNSTAKNKQYICAILDSLKRAGVNAVLFQARPSADAFYNSKYEPWSRYLTTGGKAPVPYWDPLEYIIEQAHLRGMELHAWLNPYRVTTSKNEKLPAGHIYHKHPERFVKYEGDGKIYFDPGLPENRQFIVDVVRDIISRYDVDGIHFDDYFYPYPANGKAFPDSKSYAKYGKGQKLADWRRSNVDALIQDISKTIRTSSKPWIRFGISPFGIWRNKSTDPRGSDTGGLQNYDELYADVLLWAQKGWIDYLLPQLYWELEHPKASYLNLVGWWADAVDPKCHVYIGQSVERTMKAPGIAPDRGANQLNHKIRLTRENDRILGNCWWPAYDLYNDKYKCAEALRRGAQSTPALVPVYTALSSNKPVGVKKLRYNSGTLSWTKAQQHGRTSDQVRFVVYRLDKADAKGIDNPANIVDVTGATSLKITRPGIYTVTALDRVNNESKPLEYVTVK